MPAGPLSARADVAEATRLVLRGWRPNLAYGLVAGLLIAVVLAPAVSWVAVEGLQLAAGGTVLNYDIADLALSIPGLLLFLLWTVLVALLVVLAQGGHAYTAAAVASKRVPRVPSILVQVFRDLARVPGSGAVRLTLLAALLTPLIALLVSAFGGLLLAPFQGSRLLERLPTGSALGLLLAVVGLLVGLGLTLYVRWSLAIPGLCLEGLTLRQATRRSAERTKGRLVTVAKAHLLHHAVIGLLLAATSYGLGLVGRPLVRAAFERSDGAGAWAVAVLLVVTTAVLGLLTLFGTARLVALTTIHHRKLGGTILEDRVATVQPLGDEQRVRLGLLLLVALLGLGVAAWFTLEKVDDELGRMDRDASVTAHRGSSVDAPQNTLAALRLAIEEGADACEFDVHQAKGGGLVVFHDAHLQRLTGENAPVWERTLEQLVTLDVGSHHAPRFASERMPTLEQWLRAAKGKIKLNVELKVHGRETGDYAADVLAMIRREGMLADCYVTSLDLAILKRVRELEPALPIGMIITAKVGDADRLDCDIYSVQPLYATSAFVRRAHRQGREVHVWTVNDPADMRLFVDRNVDSLITDLPRAAREIIDGRTHADRLRAAVLRLFDE